MQLCSGICARTTHHLVPVCAPVKVTPTDSAHRDDPLPLSYRKLARLNGVPVDPPNVPNESRGDFQVESGSISGKYRLFSSSEKTILGKKTTVVLAGVPDKKWNTSHRSLFENCSKLANKVVVSWERFLSEYDTHENVSQ